MSLRTSARYSVQVEMSSCFIVWWRVTSSVKALHSVGPTSTVSSVSYIVPQQNGKDLGRCVTRNKTSNRSCSVHLGWGQVGALCSALGTGSQEDMDHTERDQRKAVRIIRKVKIWEQTEWTGLSGLERTQLKEMFNSLYMHESLLQNRKE